MKEIDLPKIGSKWQHKKGAVYTIVLYANKASTKEKYPLTVVYSDKEGNVWSRLYPDWHRSMTAL